MVASALPHPRGTATDPPGASGREPVPPAATHPAFRFAVIAGIAFLTLVDLFAAQAILPALAVRYAATPMAMGVAVNASTLGMAVAGLAVALFSRRLDRRTGIVASLALLAVPTLLLAFAPTLATFAALRVLQGLCMATAFSLTLAHLGEVSGPGESATAFAAYVTGNVASNLVGRFLSAAVAGHAGLSATFTVFAALNLAGALVALAAIPAGSAAAARGPAGGPWRAVTRHLATPRLLAAFAAGFCILFAFIGTFTYVNFVLTAPPLALGMMQVGFVYFVFLPSILSTPLAGAATRRLGPRRSYALGMVLALAGLPLTLLGTLGPVLAGLSLVGVGTFFAQAVATGFVGQAAAHDRGAASGLYLAFYFTGGLAGSALVGRVFDAAGWLSSVAAIAAVLGVGLVLGLGLRLPAPR